MRNRLFNLLTTNVMFNVYKVVDGNKEFIASFKDAYEASQLIRCFIKSYGLMVMEYEREK